MSASRGRPFIAVPVRRPIVAGDKVQIRACLRTSFGNVDGVEDESSATPAVAAISVVTVLCTRTCLITADRLSRSTPAQMLAVSQLARPRRPPDHWHRTGLNQPIRSQGHGAQVWTGAVPDPASHR